MTQQQIVSENKLAAQTSPEFGEQSTSSEPFVVGSGSLGKSMDGASQQMTQSRVSFSGGQGAPTKSTSGTLISNDRADDNYAAQVHRKIVSRIQLNASLHARRIYGTARIRLVIDASGRLIDLSLAISSGHAELDQIALAQARSAAPFPKRPKTSNWAQRSFVIPMTYRQRR